VKRIVHMSDLHIGHEDLADRFDMVVQHLAFEKGDKPDAYVIVVTGDLVENANTPGAYELACVHLDKLRAAGFKHVLVVPGNHDYGTGSKGDKKFVPLFKRAFFGRELGYPKLDVLGEIAFIGLDSTAEELHWYDRLWAEGELGENQLAGLADILRSEPVRACRARVVYLHHHPFDWRPAHELKDSQQLRAVLEESMAAGASVDALLYGHNHAGLAHHGKWGIRRCYDAGSSTLKPRGKSVEWLPWFKVRAATRVIDLEQDARADYVLSPA